MTLYSPRYSDRENNVSSPMLTPKTSNVTGIIEDALIKEKKDLCGTQTSLYHRLRPGILKLYQILQLPDNVKYLVEKFSVYVVDNHRIDHETTTAQQALQLSLCWTAAYWLNYKISHKKSMTLAKEKLNFDCNSEEAYMIYSKLKWLRNMFLCNLAEQNVFKAPVAYEIPSIGDRQNLPAKPNLNIVRLEDEDLLQSQSIKNIGLQLEMDSKLVHRDVLESVKHIKKKCRKILSKLIEKQDEQKNEVRRKNEEEILRVEKSYLVESDAIRLLYRKSYTGIEIVILKNLENEFSKRIEDCKNQMELCLKALEEEQLVARNNFQEKETHLVEELKSWAQLEVLNKQFLNKTRHKSSQYAFNPYVGEEFSNKFVENLYELREKKSEVSEIISYKAVEYSVISNDIVEHLISLEPPTPATLTFNGDSCMLDKDGSCKQLGIDCLSKAPIGVPIPNLPVCEVNGVNRAATDISDEELDKSINEVPNVKVYTRRSKRNRE